MGTWKLLAFIECKISEGNVKLCSIEKAAGQASNIAHIENKTEYVVIKGPQLKWA